MTTQTATLKTHYDKLFIDGRWVAPQCGLDFLPVKKSLIKND